MISWGGSGVLSDRIDGRVIVGLAEGSTCGFDTDYKNTADPFLTEFAGWLREGSPWATMGERTSAFLSRLREQRPNDFDDGCPSLAALAVEADETRASIHWIGGMAAQLVRKGRVIESTTPHLLDTRDRLPPEAPMFLRLISARVATPTEASFDSVSWNVQPGDALVVVSHEAVCRAEWWPLPSAWPNVLDVEIVVQTACGAHARAEHKNTVGGKPVFAGVFAMVSW